MAWNGLSSSSIIRPDDRLLLRVTPPATGTPTPGPATVTPTDSPTATPAPTSQTSSQPAPSPTEDPTPIEQPEQPEEGWLLGVALAATGLILLVGFVLRGSFQESE